MFSAKFIYKIGNKTVTKWFFYDIIMIFLGIFPIFLTILTKKFFCKKRDLQKKTYFENWVFHFSTKIRKIHKISYLKHRKTILYRFYYIFICKIGWKIHVFGKNANFDFYKKKHKKIRFFLLQNRAMVFFIWCLKFPLQKIQ